jgi:hypothetical protein
MVKFDSCIAELSMSVEHDFGKIKYKPINEKNIEKDDNIINLSKIISKFFLEHGSRKITYKQINKKNIKKDDNIINLSKIISKFFLEHGSRKIKYKQINKKNIKRRKHTKIRNDIKSLSKIIKKFFQEDEINITPLNIDRFIDSSSKTETLKYNTFPYIKKVKKKDCQSYILKKNNKVSSDRDNFMQRLFLRKMLALTETKRTNYLNIKLSEPQTIDIYKPHASKPSSPASNGKIWEMEKEYSLTIVPYLHLFGNSIGKKNKANTHLSTEHAINFSCTIKEEDNLKILDFASDISNLKIFNPGSYIKLDDLRNTLLKIYSNKAKHAYPDIDNWFSDWTHRYYETDSHCIQHFVPLFLFFLIYLFVEKINKKDKSAGEDTVNDEIHEEILRIIQKYWEKWENLTFISLTISSNKFDYNIIIHTLNNIMEKKNIVLSNWFYKFIIQWVYLADDEGISKMDFFKNFVNFVKFDAEGALYYKNKRMWLKQLKDPLDDNYFDAAWGALLGTMLVRISHRLIKFNTDIDERNRTRLFGDGKAGSKYLKDLSAHALDEFKDYYDVAVLSGNTRFRSALETAKETFEINFYYDSLIKKLQLFSNYEIADEQRRLSKQISYGGLIALFVLFDTLIFLISEKLYINSNIKIDLMRIFLSPFTYTLLAVIVVLMLYSGLKSIFHKYYKHKSKKE